MTLACLKFVVVGLTTVFAVNFPNQLQAGKAVARNREGYFNGNASVTLMPPLSLLRQNGLSFRTCSGGDLIRQVSENGNTFVLSVKPTGLQIVVLTNVGNINRTLSARLIDNTWYYVNIQYIINNLTVSASAYDHPREVMVIGNDSSNYEIFRRDDIFPANSTKFTVGRNFIGCIQEGPNILLSSSVIQQENVAWGPCPIESCTKQDLCDSDQCMNHGTCQLHHDHLKCVCSAGYTGQNCEIEVKEPGSVCTPNPCLYNGECRDNGTGIPTCICSPPYTGPHCESTMSSQLCEAGTCANGGSCRDMGNMYHCICLPGFTGKQCEVDIDDCLSSPCKHSGMCIDGVNSYKCKCRLGFTGTNCETNIDECSTTFPCLNAEYCFDLHGSYVCQCKDGFQGQNCEQNINECNSSPCKNGGACEDLLGSYACHCTRGYTGKNCERVCNALCPINSHCVHDNGIDICKCDQGFSGQNCTDMTPCSGVICENGGTCMTDGDTNYICNCDNGFTGEKCELPVNVDSCVSDPCINGGTCMDNYCLCPPNYTGTYCDVHVLTCDGVPCENANNCNENNGTSLCECSPGWTGSHCNISSTNHVCFSNPCVNAYSCVEQYGSFYCVCIEGYTGLHCEIMNYCQSAPCRNGGTCINHSNGYHCNCTDGFSGDNCDVNSINNPCNRNPCNNGGTCHSSSPIDFVCYCPPGYTGPNCLKSDSVCTSNHCPANFRCIERDGLADCACPPRLKGDNCNIPVVCQDFPCENNSTCYDIGDSYKCSCLPGYGGINCEMDIDECQNNDSLCNHGLCVNNHGSYRCFCEPGFSGTNCNLDFDECLSQPCLNNGTCINKVNGFTCVCPQGFSGFTCGININECASNPCANGSTCIDLIANFTCICPPGLTGTACEINIDDCENQPCLNSGVCEDGLNSFTCNCNDTGFEGQLCDIDIDDCLSNPCLNDGNCTDRVKGFICECHLGYIGERCEEDIKDCESSPCINGGECYERSNQSLYIGDGYTIPIFNESFKYSQAFGYKCGCVVGFEGFNCEINIDDCESNPCYNSGTCKDLINNYTCACIPGYTGRNCEIEINLCEEFPCKNGGKCFNLGPDYRCDCLAGYGGKNCSVELTGCNTNPCQNSGSCKPYLFNETEQKFNCTCSNGFHGDICDKVTTFSLNALSRVAINTSREEGYDIQFRFRTTLPDVMLASGKGSTFFILDLSQGRLNLQSSLLNKWEGVFVGSTLNDGNWQKVFVAINGSHVVLAANEEQTIYPINPNSDASNASQPSFQSTYLGNIPPELRGVRRGPTSYIGCMEDVVVNEVWFVPEEKSQNILKTHVTPGCSRNSSLCTPNPCYNNGICTDKWENFFCSCLRPYLGSTCQYNITAATFGYENINDSLVTVDITEGSRKAIRSIIDISMFIRTREEKGAIFYLTSESTPNQAVIAAHLANGELNVCILLNGTPESSPESWSVGSSKLSDGNYHLIQVVRNVTLVQVKVNGTEHFRKTITASGHLDVHTLYLGGYPPFSRSVRQVESVVGNKGCSTSSCDVNFKGIIQDVEISNGSRTMVVEFFPLTATDVDKPIPFGEVYFNNSLVLEGVQSDDMCVSNPCEDKGTCVVTWNDFECRCLLGYKGKTCQEMEFCQLQDCPDGSTCRSLEDGFECIANATFNGIDTAISYGINLTGQITTELTTLTTLEVTYRSKEGGTILHISDDKGCKYFSLSVFMNEVTLIWKQFEQNQIKRFPKLLDINEWTTLIFDMQEDVIRGNIKGTEDNEMTMPMRRDLWLELVLSGNIVVGKAPDHTVDTCQSVSEYSTDLVGNEVFLPPPNITSGGYFKGCLGEVRIGSYLLPYFPPEELKPFNGSIKDLFFVKEIYNSTKAPLLLDCILCLDKECGHGSCSNASESYDCQCLPGYEGEHCDINIDECLNNECDMNSTCKDGINGYECICLAGWTGIYCNEDIDECLEHPCLNGGTCSNYDGGFSCGCPAEFTGEHCEDPILITCEHQPCRSGSTCVDIGENNFTCLCPKGFEGNLCKTAFCDQEKCKNGYCNKAGEFAFCQCSAGYEGRLCETNIDDCVPTGDEPKCGPKGACIDGINSYSCDCRNTGFKGKLCEIDIDECQDGIALCVNGLCNNTEGDFYCVCNEGYCGKMCDVPDPCMDLPCQNGGTCRPDCVQDSDYRCDCTEGYGGKNCSMKEEALGSNAADVAIIIAPILGAILLAAVIGLSVFISMARKKRATRGTYSPSQQEYCNPRVEMDNVMKPPPEERLI